MAESTKTSKFRKKPGPIRCCGTERKTTPQQPETPFDGDVRTEKPWPIKNSFAPEGKKVKPKIFCKRNLEELGDAPRIISHIIGNHAFNTQKAKGYSWLSHEAL